MGLSPRRSISTVFQNSRKRLEFVHATPGPDSSLWHGERVPRGWKEAGQAVNARRLLMGLSAKDLATNAGVDARTIADLIHARRSSFSDVTLANIEHALAWRAGSIMSMALDGQEPVDDDGLVEIIKAWPTLSPEMKAALLRFVDGS